MHWWSLLVLANAVAGGDILPPPAPEPIALTTLPLPPVSDSADGACTATTGCIKQTKGLLQAGSFLPDSIHMIATLNYTGAPAGSIYAGPQAVIIKTDGRTFPNGDPWKCITCGVPSANAVGLTDHEWNYPQSFSDSKRLLVGTRIVQCDEPLASTTCTPNNTYMYPLYCKNTADGSGPGGPMRELRLHPDDQHLAWNSFVIDDSGFDQFSYYGKLVVKSMPTTGEPLAPRFDLETVSVLFSPDANATIAIDPERPDHLLVNKSAIEIGEARGFSGAKNEVAYIGYPVESCNMDVFAVKLTNGALRRITSHPEYCDPLGISADGEWSVVLDTRRSERMIFMSGLRGIPPLVDLVATAAVSSVRVNGVREFYDPWLVDYHGERGSYFGQMLNDGGSGIPGSGAFNDPNWFAQADPRWSPDGTKIVVRQELILPPACGVTNQPPCPDSTEPGGERARILFFNLTSRQPTAPPTQPPGPELVPWGIPYVPDTIRVRKHIPGGSYILEAGVSGHATVTITENSEKTEIVSVAVEYDNYSEDGLNVLNGFENVTATARENMAGDISWFSDLVQTGPWNGTKKTSPDGLHLAIDVLGDMPNIFRANGTLITIVNGESYHQPENNS